MQEERCEVKVVREEVDANTGEFTTDVLAKKES